MAIDRERERDNMLKDYAVSPSQQHKGQNEKKKRNEIHPAGHATIQNIFGAVSLATHRGGPVLRCFSILRALATYTPAPVAIIKQIESERQKTALLLPPPLTSTSSLLRKLKRKISCISNDVDINIWNYNYHHYRSFHSRTSTQKETGKKKKKRESLTRYEPAAKNIARQTPGQLGQMAFFSSF